MVANTTSPPDRTAELVGGSLEPRLARAPVPALATGARVDPLTEPAPPNQRSRIVLIDKLRGLVIVVMMLDHVREYFHVQATQFSATNLAKASTALFATRWVTHFCAPTFVLLAGVAVHLQWSRGKRGWRLSGFLVTRGLWLIVLEVTLVTVAFTFAWDGALLQVIWAIGFSMVLLGALVWLSPPIMLTLGLAIIAGHDLLDHVDVRDLGAWAPLWTLMLTPGMIHLALPRFSLDYVSYPALPWFGIMAAGFGAGGVFLLPPARRDRVLVAFGLAMLAAFALLRGIDAYGDPAPWTRQAGAIRTVLSFVNVTKYPPSLSYTLLTLGVVLALAPAIGRIGGVGGRLILTFGRTPLFTYLAHLYVARGLAVLLALAQGVPPTLFAHAMLPGSRLAASGWGLNLPGVYAVWLAVLLIVWPLSTWYAGFKARHRYWWLSYL